ncbi:hypothetical protein FCH28_26370 [Streptomyces piniterrae]|uniref:Uncharacterized protein n=1 Tax=Streptomyces piniterrae TaxID=2571125 RepID=A0A4U0MYT9_9ACTN|nr:hypothetical protein [Streptomyces piniterrae]TJZ46056.1 hypothetical protein FCH28_26370 [Streptomyces piniterrae]
MLFVVCFTKGLTAAGLTGTHGTFTVEECFRESTSHRSTASDDYQCEGTFRSDDGKVVDDKASLGSLNTSYDPGFELATQGHNDSTVLSVLSAATYTVAGREAATANFSTGFAFLLFIIPLQLFSWLRRFDEPTRTIPQQWAAWRATAGTRTRKIVLGAAAAALFGMIVVGPVLGFALTAGS